MISGQTGHPCLPLPRTTLPFILALAHPFPFGHPLNPDRDVGWQCDTVGFEGTLMADSQLWHWSVVTFRATCPTLRGALPVQALAQPRVGREDSGSRPSTPARPGSRCVCSRGGHSLYGPRCRPALAPIPWHLQPTRHSADQAMPLQQGGTVVGSSPWETCLGAGLCADTWT